ncbi:MAG TPA: tRNA uridine-5-carboxymethylaminomethyl(34) synthesis GTPase MnmE [Thermodesulfovibrionales bacterium]|nr:tRNA uridine-5-carboxymethylaminomethyl(34) synthesis GTPase MnmE [Thermodesulfovibrionales bacterium]
MFTDDTIAAISTPLGEGGIGIVRLSGKEALRIADSVFLSPKGKTLAGSGSHRLFYGLIVDPNSGAKIDEVLASVMKSPHSYTMEDIVEINCHSGMVTLRKTLELVLRHGARLAEPGEFTKRAFLNGRIDLSQAEAVLDLIRSKTDESRRIAVEQLQGTLFAKITSLRDQLTDVCVHLEADIDFPEDEIETSSVKNLLNAMDLVRDNLSGLLKTYDEARFFREGLQTAIVGRPNVGKSSLLNALLQKDRAIVTEIPGTTRDILEEHLNIKGLPLRIMDTAGIRQVQDIAEKEGVRRSLQSIENADIVLAIFDGSEPLREEDFEVLRKVMNKPAIYVLNKSDLPAAIDHASFSSFDLPSTAFLSISATRGDGVEDLKDKVVDSCVKNWKEEREGVVVSNLRHKTSLERAAESLEKARMALIETQPLEIVAIEIRASLDSLGEIVGAVTTEEILNRIFSDFCIGK